MQSQRENIALRTIAIIFGESNIFLNGGVDRTCILAVPKNVKNKTKKALLDFYFYFTNKSTMTARR